MNSIWTRCAGGLPGRGRLRQHIRRELEEHIRDSAAGYVAGGLAEEEALAKALEDFGGPEQVRAELEAAHGHRVMGVVVDKALEWKEKTVKAKWLWTTWAHTMLVLTIAVEVVFVFGCVIFIIPKFRELLKDGWIEMAETNALGQLNAWAWSVLPGVTTVARDGWWVLAAAVLSGVLFEWRVKSDHKTLMRLGGLGTLALSLGVVAFMTAAALILPLIMLAHPVYHANLAFQLRTQHAQDLELSLKVLDEAIVAKDWQHMAERVRRVEGDMDKEYMFSGASLSESVENAERVRTQFREASSLLHEAHRAADHSNTETFAKAMAGFREAYARVKGAASQPGT